MKRPQEAVALALAYGRMSMDLVVPRLSSQYSFKQDFQTSTYLQHKP
jgi:hypothetical protein